MQRVGLGILRSIRSMQLLLKSLAETLEVNVHEVSGSDSKKGLPDGMDMLNRYVVQKGCAWALPGTVVFERQMSYKCFANTDCIATFCSQFSHRYRDVDGETYTVQGWCQILGKLSRGNHRNAPAWRLLLEESSGAAPHVPCLVFWNILGTPDLSLQEGKLAELAEFFSFGTSARMTWLRPPMWPMAWAVMMPAPSCQSPRPRASWSMIFSWAWLQMALASWLYHGSSAWSKHQSTDEDWHLQRAQRRSGLHWTTWVAHPSEFQLLDLQGPNLLWRQGASRQSRAPKR